MNKTFFRQLIRSSHQKLVSRGNGRFLRHWPATNAGSPKLGRPALPTVVFRSYYCATPLAFLRTELGLAFAHGIPFQDTLERLVQRLAPQELASVLCACATSLVGQQSCLNGKEHRITTSAAKR